MTNPNKGQLYEQVAHALTNSPSKQPVKNAGHVDSKPENDQKKVRQTIPASKKIHNRNAFSFTKSYPVSVIHKAQAKMG